MAAQPDLYFAAVSFVVRHENAGGCGGKTLEEQAMKAIIRTRYGSPDVLRFAEMPKPAPADNEVLIKVCAASVNPVDLFLMKGWPGSGLLPGLRTPKQTILGCDIAGRVETAGKNVTRFRPGDEVFGVTGFDGKAFAEYACAMEEKLALKPSNVSFADAAAVPIAGTTALQGLRDKGGIQPGQKVLVEGASGGVGTFAVQIAKAFGAHVTAVCSTRKVETARAIGADQVIDYTQADFARGGQRYDLIVAANAHHAIFAYRHALTPRGVYVAAGGGAMRMLEAMLLGPLLSHIGHKKMSVFMAKMKQDDLAFLKELLEAGKVVPVIDRRYPLSETAEALRYLAEGHARGKIVITV
jgi:NADPH:quinone reductase-like Zn-dependent oxidoreductase